MGLRRPQVIVNEKVLASFVSPPGERVAAMIGTANWGPIGVVKHITSFPEFINVFGDEKETDGLTLIKGADLFFRNGGTLKVVRLEDNSADYADITLNGNVSNVLTDMIIIKGKYKGSLGNNINIIVEENGSNINFIVNSGVIKEIYNNNGEGFSKNKDIVDSINNFSRLITAEILNEADNNLIISTSEVFLTGGSDGDVGLDSNDYADAFDKALAYEEFNYLLCPGKTTDDFNSTLLSKIILRASTEDLYSRYISGIGIDEDIETIGERTTFDKRFSLISPNVKYLNRYSGKEQILDGSYLSCAYTGKLCTLNYGESMTRKSINVNGLSINILSGKEFYSKSEQEQVLQNNCIPITNINNEIVVSRAITRENDETSLFFEEIIVDISDLIKKRMQIICDNYIGEPNSIEVRDLLASELNGELKVQQNLNIITEFSPTSVIEGESSDSMVVTVGYKPVRATNFIYFNININ